MIDRRGFLRLPAGVALTGAVYSVAVEPNFFLDVTRYRVTPKDWPRRSDPAHRGHHRSARLRALDAGVAHPPDRRGDQRAFPDLIALLGDFRPARISSPAAVRREQWAEALSTLKAPLGVHAVLGNHDWWHGPLTSDAPDGAEGARRALTQMGARVYENDALRLEKNGQPFWLLGLADQLADYFSTGARWTGHDDLDATLRASPTTRRRSCWRMSRSFSTARRGASR